MGEGKRKQVPPIMHSDIPGLLGFWLLPWGLCIAAALWATRAKWVPSAR